MPRPFVLLNVALDTASRARRHARAEVSVALVRAANVLMRAALYLQGVDPAAIRHALDLDDEE